MFPAVVGVSSTPACASLASAMFLLIVSISRASFISIAISSCVGRFAAYLAMEDVCFGNVGMVLFVLRNQLVGSKINVMFSEVLNKDSK